MSRHCPRKGVLLRHTVVWLCPVQLHGCSHEVEEPLLDDVRSHGRPHEAEESPCVIVRPRGCRLLVRCYVTSFLSSTPMLLVILEA